MPCKDIGDGLVEAWGVIGNNGERFCKTLETNRLAIFMDKKSAQNYSKEQSSYGISTKVIRIIIGAPEIKALK